MHRPFAAEHTAVTDGSGNRPSPMAARSRADAGLAGATAIAQAMVTAASRKTSWTAWRSSTPSAMGRWKALRPTMSPVPPARLLMTAVRTAWARSSAPLDSPPELMSPMRPA